jgi:methionyl-tRNA formyltransferase
MISKKAKSYLVLGSHSWNEEAYANFKKKRNEKWEYTSNRRMLNIEILKKVDPTYIFVLHWNHIIPDELIERFRFVIFHMTDLPFGRGGSPLQNLIISGINRTKLSALLATSELDSGPIFLKRDLDLTGSAQEIYTKASNISMEMAREIISKKMEPKTQNGEISTFYRRTPADSELPETFQDANSAYDFIRMLDAQSYPRAFKQMVNYRIEFEDAKILDGCVEAKCVFKFQ